MLNVFIKAKLTVLYYLQAPIITKPVPALSDQIQFSKNDNNMQLSAIRLRGGVEGIIIMHVSASYIDWHTTVEAVPSVGAHSLHTTYVLCEALHHIVCYQFP